MNRRYLSQVLFYTYKMLPIHKKYKEGYLYRKSSRQKQMQNTDKTSFDMWKYWVWEAGLGAGGKNELWFRLLGLSKMKTFVAEAIYN